jgi:hypothetical protein
MKPSRFHVIVLDEQGNLPAPPQLPLEHRYFYLNNVRTDREDMTMQEISMLDQLTTPRIDVRGRWTLKINGNGVREILGHMPKPGRDSLLDILRALLNGANFGKA